LAWARSLLALAAVLLVACAPAPQEPAQDLLLISIDTLRADALGLYGGQRGASPRLDTWGQGAAVFLDAFTHSPKTAPSHMSLFTGLLPHEHGVSNLDARGAARLDASQPMLAELLAGQGFRTNAVTGGGNVRAQLGFDRGFDAYHDRGEGLEQALSRSAQWLQRKPTEDARWFFFLHTYQVHDPYIKGARYLTRFTDPSYPGRILGDPEALVRAIQAGEDLAPKATGPAKLTGNFWRRADERDPRDQRHLFDLYLAGVAQMDDLLGSWLERLGDRGVLDRALVVLTSDHGEEFAEHGGLRHDQLYSEVAHVPLIVRHPSGVGAGKRFAGLVGHRDFLPSVLELLGLESLLPAGAEGRSWAPVLLGRGPLPSGAAIWSMHQSDREGPLDSLFVRTSTLAWFQSPRGLEVYDRSLDPGELSPLAPQHPARRELEVQAAAVFLGFQRRALAAPGQRQLLDDAARAELQALGYLDPDE
jgi:arylsulfatase A-like enzyme